MRVCVREREGDGWPICPIFMKYFVDSKERINKKGSGNPSEMIER